MRPVLDEDDAMALPEQVARLGRERLERRHDILLRWRLHTASISTPV